MWTSSSRIPSILTSETGYWPKPSLYSHAGEGSLRLCNAYSRLLAADYPVRSRRRAGLEFNSALRRCDLQEHYDHRRGSPANRQAVVMHGYEQLRPQLIREVAERDVPRLLEDCLRMLAERNS